MQLKNVLLWNYTKYWRNVARIAATPTVKLVMKSLP